MISASDDTAVLLANAKVMIVDDLQANVDVLTRLLTKTGVGTITGYTDSVAALADCERSAPDLVLLDLHMPQLDGLGFLGRLRKNESLSTFVPVLVLTADITPDTRREVLAAGAKDFLTKPFDIVEVALRVRNLLETAALHAALRRHATRLEAQLEIEQAAERDASKQRAIQLERVTQAMTPGCLSIVYQPFVTLAGRCVVGAEALARFDATPQRTPDLWFAEAAEVGLLGDLERHAIQCALEGLDHFEADAFMSLNVSAQTATSEAFTSMLDELPADRIVLELTEHAQVHDYDVLHAALASFRDRGGRIAIDDAGAGYAGLQHILAVRPDIIKLDIALVRGIDTDPVRQALATAMVQFAGAIGAELIAEGVETADETAVLSQIGVRWGQGFYLARPAPLPLRLEPQAEPLRSIKTGASWTVAS